MTRSLLSTRVRRRYPETRLPSSPAARIAAPAPRAAAMVAAASRPPLPRNGKNRMMATIVAAMALALAAGPALAAWDGGFFDDYVIPVEVPQRKGPPLLFEKDEAVRPDTSLEKLAKLRTIYDSPTVTPGNAPGLSTGASAVVLTTRQEAERRGIEPLANIRTWAMVAGHPDRIASIPATAAQKALDQLGMTIDDIDWFVPHQANLRIIEAVAGRIGLPMDKVIINLDRYGNTSAATIPTALDEAIRDGRIRQGQTVLTDAFGSGLTAGALLFRW